MSWLLDTVANALDSADAAAAEVASSHGFIPASALDPDASASLVASEARDKVRKRLESQATRSAPVPPVRPKIVSPPGDPSPTGPEELPSPRTEDAPSEQPSEPAQSQGDNSKEVEELRGLLQEKCQEAEDNLAALEESEKARRELDQAMMDLQRKATDFMTQYTAAKAESEESKAELEGLRAEMKEKALDAEEASEENEEQKQALEKAALEHHKQIQALTEAAETEAAQERKLFEEKVKAMEAERGEMLRQHAQSLRESTSTIARLQGETESLQQQVRVLTEGTHAKERSVDDELQAMRRAVTIAEQALAAKTLEMDQLISKELDDSSAEFGLKSELYEAKQQLDTEMSRTATLEAELAQELSARDDAEACLREELAAAGHETAALQAQLEAITQKLDMLMKEQDSSQVAKLKARNAEMATSLVGKQAQIDDLLSSKQAVTMRAEADRTRAEQALTRLKSQLHDDEADLEQGGGSHKKFRKLEQKYVPRQAANAIDRLSLVVVNLVRHFPLVRLGLVLYLVMYVSAHV